MGRHASFVVAASFALVAGCTGPIGLGPNPTPDGAHHPHHEIGADAGMGVARDGGGIVLLPVAVPVTTSVFATADRCATCHANSASATAMRDARGRGIAPADLWVSSMMANAVRDPFFRAVFSAELAATPSAKAAIETKCLTCHAPMASTEAKLGGTHLSLADVYAGNTLGQLALDGVSCTSCHQIEAEGLGTDGAFSGGYVIGRERNIYGPHADPFAMPMQHHTSYVPTRADHVTDSKLCASCHTLFTHSIDADGASTGATLPEQTPYLEWRNSSFSGEGAQSCQSCHVPTTDEDGNVVRTPIARNPNGGDFGRIDPRAPFGRHTFVGGNTLVLSMLRDHADELAPVASTAAFDATIAATRAQLSERTARLVLGAPRGAAGMTEIDVTIMNLTGHKLPTAYPSRRVWLHVRLRGADGQVRFESGAFDARGRLVDERGAPLPSELAGGPLLAHVDRVASASAPAEWHAAMGDGDGAPTFTLLRGARYLKDNRLLPAGWRADHPDVVSTAPVGVGDDPSFRPGQDTVTVVFDGRAGSVLEVELLYQSISPRWAAEVATRDTPEVAAFSRYWAQADVRPERLAHAELTLP